MMELFHLTFSSQNIIPALILTFVLFYWLLVILGALDISSFDFDLDIDADADLEADAGEASISWLNNILSFFNIDKIPLMIFLTFWAIPLWVISIIVNYAFGNESFLVSLVFLVPNIIVSLLVAKPLTMPFVKVFAKLNQPTEQSSDLLGRIGKVVISASETKIGQADVNISGSSYRLNIKTKTGGIKRGKSMLVINFIKEGKYYLVEPYETID